MRSVPSLDVERTPIFTMGLTGLRIVKFLQVSDSIKYFGRIVYWLSEGLN